MAIYIARRILYMIPVLLLVSMISFTITMLLPGDPAMLILGDQAARDPVMYEALRKDLGLDRPLPVQYADWLSKSVTGNLGISVRNRQPVTEAVMQRLPVTLELGFLAMLLAVAIAVPAGIISAIKPNSRVDVAATLVSLTGVAIPHFWLGILLMWAFALTFRWLPPSGYVSPLDNPEQNLRLMLMPAITLGAGVTAVIMRQVRSGLIEVMQQDYITTARSKGLAERIVVAGHALRNALIPVVTVVGLQTGRIFGGAVITETIFSLPGVGRLAADSIFTRDFPVVQGVVLVIAVAVLLANLVTDVMYAYIDPRIRYD